MFEFSLQMPPLISHLTGGLDYFSVKPQRRNLLAVEMVIAPGCLFVNGAQITSDCCDRAVLDLEAE